MNAKVRVQNFMLRTFLVLFFLQFNKSVWFVNKKTPHHFWQGVSNRAILNTNNPIKSTASINTIH